MKLIIIYGQEATGKLTIAKALAERTGFKLFHNHVSVDVAKTLFNYGDPRYDDLVVATRLLVFESAAKNATPGLIFTWAYTHPECHPQFEAIKATIEPYGAELCLVHVHCSQAQLEKRVLSPHRVAMGKINTIEHLHRQQKRKNCIPIPDTGSLILDNTDISPEEAAGSIATTFNL